VKSLHNAVPASHIIIVAQGCEPIVPDGMTGAAGILVRRTEVAVLQYWDGLTWKRTNRAGWAARFHEQMPQIAQGSWAVVHSLPLATNAPELYLTFSPATLTWALHLIDHPHPRKHASYAFANPQTELEQDVADYLLTAKSV
jgi:hypothetical protein